MDIVLYYVKILKTCKPDDNKNYRAVAIND